MVEEQQSAASAASRPVGAGERHYERFSTVDWVVDRRRERGKALREEERLQHIAERVQEGGSPTWRRLDALALRLPYAHAVRRVLNALGERLAPVLSTLHAPLMAAIDSGIVVLVGALIGVNMAAISIITEWASDLKQGYCSTGWWLNKKFCCWEQMDPAGPGGNSVPKNIAAVAQAAATTSVAASASVNVTATARSLEALWPRANVTAPTMTDTCPEWVEWSTYTVPSWFIFVASAAMLAFVAAFLVKSYAPYAAGSGISEIKCVIAGFIMKEFLGLWTLIIKSIGLPLSIASGLSVGKEGPAVHMACCMGNVVAHFLRRLIRSQEKLREVLTASSAAGIAVAFGSPIGGVLFALEEMTTHFPPSTMWRSFLCALSSTVMLSFMNPFRTGKLVLFQVEYTRSWHYFEIFFYIIIGIVGGLYGEYVLRYNMQVQRFRRKRLASRGIAEAVILAVVTAMVAYFNRFLRLDMNEALEILFRQCEGASEEDVLCQSRSQWAMVTSLFLATALRFAFVIFSYGCKVPAGIFVPSMAVGAMFGRMVGILVKALQNAFPTWHMFAACPPEQPCITPGTYAVLGAAAALAGVTRITVAVVVIMFELTGALTYILPIMLVVGIAKLMADLCGKGGVSERQIKLNGYPMLDEDEHTFGIPVSTIMKKDPVIFYAEGTRLDEVEERLDQGTYKGFPVVRSAEDPTLLGYVARADLAFALRSAHHTQPLARDTSCVFTPRSADDYIRTTTIVNGHDLADTGAPLSNTPSSTMWASLPFSSNQGLFSESTEDADLSAAEVSELDGTLDLGHWVDPTPLVVLPELALEVVYEMFIKLGPRVILVTENGQLQGMVTVKDVLQHIAAQERKESNRGLDPLRSDGQGPEFDVGTGKLEALLDTVWLWASVKMASLKPYYDPVTPPTTDQVPLRSITTLYEGPASEQESQLPGR